MDDRLTGCLWSSSFGTEQPDYLHVRFDYNGEVMSRRDHILRNWCIYCVAQTVKHSVIFWIQNCIHGDCYILFNPYMGEIWIQTFPVSICEQADITVSTGAWTRLSDFAFRGTIRYTRSTAIYMHSQWLLILPRWAMMPHSLQNF